MRKQMRRSGEEAAGAEHAARALAARTARLSPAHVSPQAAPALQRAIGNRALSRLVDEGHDARGAQRDRDAAAVQRAPGRYEDEGDWPPSSSGSRYRSRSSAPRDPRSSRSASPPVVTVVPRTAREPRYGRGSRPPTSSSSFWDQGPSSASDYPRGRSSRRDSFDASTGRSSSRATSVRASSHRRTPSTDRSRPVEIVSATPDGRRVTSFDTTRDGLYPPNARNYAGPHEDTRRFSMGSQRDGIAVPRERRWESEHVVPGAAYRRAGVPVNLDTRPTLSMPFSQHQPPSGGHGGGGYVSSTGNSHVASGWANELASGISRRPDGSIDVTGALRRTTTDHLNVPDGWRNARGLDHVITQHRDLGEISAAEAGELRNRVADTYYRNIELEERRPRRSSSRRPSRRS